MFYDFFGRKILLEDLEKNNQKAAKLNSALRECSC